MYVPLTSNKCNRLTAEIVLECRKRAREGESTTSLARVYGVSAETMRKAVRGETWAWVDGAAMAEDAAERARREEQMSANAAESLAKLQTMLAGEPTAEVHRTDSPSSMDEDLRLYLGDRYKGVQK